MCDKVQPAVNTLQCIAPSATREETCNLEGGRKKKLKKKKKGDASFFSHNLLLEN